MIPIELNIRGFGPHADTTLDFRNRQSPLALRADYGTGKTFALEAILFALYGRWAWYGDSPYDALTQGGAGEGAVAFTFSHAGATFVVERLAKDTGKTQTHRANVWRDGQPVAGPKVSDVARYIGDLLGDFDIATSTWFLSQCRLNDLCGQPGEKELAARRRAVFTTLTNGDRIDAWAKAAAEEARAARGAIAELASQLAAEGDIDAAIDAAQAHLADSKRAAAIARGSVSLAEEALTRSMARLRDAQAGDDAIVARIASHRAAIAHRDTLRERRDELGLNQKNLSEQADRRDDLARECDRLANARAKIRRLEALSTAWDAHVAWETERDRLNDKIAEQQRARADLLALPAPTDDDRAMAEALPALRAEYARVRDENNARAARNAAREKKRNARQTAIANCLKRDRELRDRAATTPVTPFGDDCAPCPLMREWAAIPQRIALEERRCAVLQRSRDAIQPDEPIDDLAPIQERGERAAAAHRAVDAYANTQTLIARASATIDDRQRCLDALLAREPERVDNPADQLKATRETERSLAGVPERLDAATRAAERLEELAPKLAAAIVEYETAEQAVRDGAERYENDCADMKQRQLAVESLRQAVAVNQQAVNDARDDLERALAAHAACETRMEAAVERREQIAAKRERLAALEADRDGFEDLCSCFGPKGVKSILVDDAAPILEEIADDLFDVATGGRLRFRVQTQKVNRDGSLAEDFSLLVQDERGWRDVTRFSGGQLQLNLIVFRLALAIHISRLRQQPIDFLILDEACDRLGDLGAADLIRVLEHIGSQIALVVVVTHDDAIASRFADQIRMVGGLAGVQVV